MTYKRNHKMMKPTPQPLTEAEVKELAQLEQEILCSNFFTMLMHTMQQSPKFKRMEELKIKQVEYARYKHYQEILSAQPLSKAEEKELENLIREMCPELNEAGEEGSGWVTIPLVDDSDPRIKRIIELIDRQTMYEKKVRRQAVMN